jgi:hypothetical protein
VPRVPHRKWQLQLGEKKKRKKQSSVSDRTSAGHRKTQVVREIMSSSPTEQPLKKTKTLADVKKTQKETFSEAFTACLQPLLAPFLRALYGFKPVFPNARTSNGWGDYNEDTDTFSNITITQPMIGLPQVFEVQDRIRMLARRRLPGSADKRLAFDISTLSTRAIARLFAGRPWGDYRRLHELYTAFAVYCVWRHAVADSLNFAAMARSMNERRITVYWLLEDKSIGSRNTCELLRVRTTRTGKLSSGHGPPGHCEQVFRVLDCLYISSEVLLGTRFPTDIEDIVLSYISGQEGISRAIKLVD